MALDATQYKYWNQYTDLKSKQFKTYQLQILGHKHEVYTTKSELCDT